MTKTSSQMKNIVEDWIKISKVPYKETTEEMNKLGHKLDWQFLINERVHITKVANRDDRIDMHISTNFQVETSSKLVTGTNEVENKINGINVMVTTNGLLINWHVKDGLVTGFDVKCYMDSEEFERPLFFHNWDRLVNLQHSTSIELVRFGDPNQPTTSTDSTSSTMYQ